MEIFVGALIVVTAIFYSLYVKGISLKNAAQEAKSSIGIQLQKRRDLIPNVLKLAGKYMKHEKQLLTDLTNLRSLMSKSEVTDDFKQAMQLDNSIASALGRFFAVAENYPDLNANENINYAQQTVSEVEGHIAAARRFYNAAVTDINNYCETFPSSMLKGLAGAESLPYYEASTDSKDNIDVNDHIS